ncbi:hypothetical protein BV898_16552 [Hypsibius exemplaris]|uniref:G-protein coupled receptors family 1 profile domain-containing protein n=1 Tax=Hypsibius exemplaris TaxID=2072580 RepID=A0A9X6NM67_HYPEX|nr:hypothetical protein BV898_16552 [Hypsibius exemplaris]
MAANLSHNVSRELLSPFAIIRPWEFPLLIKVTTYGGFILTVAACLIYLEIVIAFVRNRNLITPFSIHIVSMVAINLITTAVYDPIMLTRNLSREMFRGNYSLCGLYKYLQWTTMSLSALQHGIICVDRWLAIVLPNWYRTKTIRFGVFSTVTVVVYQQLWYLPLFLTDVLLPRIGPDDLCDYTKALLGYQQVVSMND